MAELIGKTKIELQNTLTGEREVYEKHNIVTNALRDIFRPIGLSSKADRYYKDFLPYYQKLLGGILCFDSSIAENPDNYYPPSQANLICCAAYGTQNNTKNILRGGFNQTESEVNLKDRYVKYVYDFATSQANGTIACVCLTHLHGGFSSYGGSSTVYTTSYPLMQYVTENTLQYVYQSNTGAKTSSRYSSLTVGVSEMIFLVDREEDCVLYFKIIDSTHAVITKRRAFLKSVSILDNCCDQKPLVDEISLSELNISLNTSYLGYNYDPASDSLFICSANSSATKPGERIVVTQIKIGSWEVSQHEVTNTSDVNLNTSGLWSFFVYDGFLYLKAQSSPYDLFKIEIAAPANIVKFKRTNVTNINAYPKFAVNGRIFFEDAQSQTLVANTYTNEIMPPESKSYFSSYNQTNVTPVRNEPLLYFADYGSSYAGGWYMWCSYLATINNLDAPITKTADKTMKITYILQEV